MDDPSAPPLALELGTVDLQIGVLQREDGATVTLTPKERALLAHLAHHPGAVVRRETLLVEVWGYAPDVVSRAVDKTMARLRTKVERSPSTPRHLISVPGEGYRFAPLPRPKADPWARTELVERLAPALRAGGGVWVLHGPGGVGKTWLARTLLDRHGPGCFVDLSTCGDHAEAEACITAALGAGSRAGWSAACQALGRGPMVLDNTEQLGPIGSLVDALATPDLRLLVTSRHHPAFPATAVAVPPLDATAGRALLLERSGLASDGLDTDALDALDAVVAWLDGLPLAIELAARRLRWCSLADLHARLGDQPAILSDPARPERHQSLLSALRWSWDLLAPADRDALVACSTFRGTFALDALETVLDDADPFERLDSLSSASLVMRSSETGRFSVHGAVAAFVAETARPGARQAATLRHLTWYAAHAPRWAAAVHTPDSPAAWARLDSERANLLAAFDTACRVADASAAVAVSRGLQPLLRTRGPASRWATVNAALVDLTRGASPHIAGRARLHRGVERLVTGNVEPATTDLHAALAAGRAAEDPTLTGMAAIRLAFVQGLLGTGDPDALLTEAHDLGVAAEHPRLQALALGDRGILAWRSGAFSEAEHAFARADHLFARTGDHVQRATTAVNRGHNARAQGRDDIATAHFTLAEHLAERCGYRRVRAVAALEQGDIRMVGGDLTGALACFDAAHTHGQALGSAELVGVAAVRAACVHHVRGADALGPLLDALDTLAGVDTQAAEGGWFGLALQSLLRRGADDLSADGSLALARGASPDPAVAIALARPSQPVPTPHLLRADLLRWQWVVGQTGAGVTDR